MGHRHRLAALVAATICLVGPAGRAACRMGVMAELPVTMIRLKPRVSIGINGTPVQFVADSGSAFTQVTLTEAYELRLPRTRQPLDFKVPGVGGGVRIWLTRVDDFTLGGATVHGIKMIAAASAPGNDILGRNVLTMGDSEYDLGHGVIRLIDRNGCDSVQLAYWDRSQPYTVIDTLPDRGAPFPRALISVSVNGITLRALLDSGSDLTVMSLGAAKRVGLALDSPGVTDGGDIAGVSGRRLPTWLTPISEFRIGDEAIKNTRLRVADASLGDFDMLVGADFFLSHHIYIATRLHKVYFTYNGGPVFNLQVSPHAAGPAAAGP